MNITTPNAADFAHVTEWVFDLDNTLYPHHTNLFSQIDVKMTEYVSKILQLPKNEARKVQKQYYLEYGTTLSGLMANHEVEPKHFLDHVHDIDYSWLEPNPALGDALAALPGRRLIFTNGDVPHAENTARALGILEHFDDIFDVVAADLVPKPARSTYEKFQTKHNVDCTKAAMFEDLARNLEVPKSMGMQTVLIIPNDFEPTFSEHWEHDGVTDYVDHTTDEITEFLKQIMR